MPFAYFTKNANKRNKNQEEKKAGTKFRQMSLLPLIEVCVLQNWVLGKKESAMYKHKDVKETRTCMWLSQSMANPTQCTKASHETPILNLLQWS